ncbi:hypothetical protein RCH06_001696 [Polaromonas sp. CG_9.5]|uniref:hypothetical protein n=1 Tax=Polaromonas sp. CG_9.5 TaxID=3071705 RepID=UPI002E0CA9B2|nr:hypothetical protein [Polaromonas sp. CG_9.5]
MACRSIKKAAALNLMAISTAYFQRFWRLVAGSYMGVNTVTETRQAAPILGAINADMD